MTRTGLSKLGQVLDLSDLRQTLLFCEAVEGIFEEVLVRRKAGVFRNTIVVLAAWTILAYNVLLASKGTAYLASQETASESGPYCGTDVIPLVESSV